MTSQDKEAILRRITSAQDSLLDVQQELLNLSVIVLGLPTSEVVTGDKAAQILKDGETDFPEDGDSPEAVPTPQEPAQVEVPSDTGNPVPDSEDSGSDG